MGEVTRGSESGWSGAEAEATAAGPLLVQRAVGALRLRLTSHSWAMDLAKVSTKALQPPYSA